MLREDQIHLDIAHEITLDSSCSALRQLHLIVKGEGNNNVTTTRVVEGYISDYAYLIAVGENGIRRREPTDVAERGVVDVFLREQRDAFEEIHAEEQDDDACDGDECYFDFFFHVSSIFLCSF